MCEINIHELLQLSHLAVNLPDFMIVLLYDIGTETRIVAIRCPYIARKSRTRMTPEQISHPNVAHRNLICYI